jgi:hypothetical protein
LGKVGGWWIKKEEGFFFVVVGSGGLNPRGGPPAPFFAAIGIFFKRERTSTQLKVKILDVLFPASRFQLLFSNYSEIEPLSLLSVPPSFPLSFPVDILRREREDSQKKGSRRLNFCSY